MQWLWTFLTRSVMFRLRWRMSRVFRRDCCPSTFNQRQNPRTLSFKMASFPILLGIRILWHHNRVIPLDLRWGFPTVFYCFPSLSFFPGSQVRGAPLPSWYRQFRHHLLHLLQWIRPVRRYAHMPSNKRPKL